MQKRMLFGLVPLIILIFASGMAMGTDSNFCPIPPDIGKAAVDLPQTKLVTPEKSYSVPRDQVLLEIATATT